MEWRLAMMVWEKIDDVDDDEWRRYAKEKRAKMQGEEELVELERPSQAARPATFAIWWPLTLVDRFP
jgi:hypothetical protein